MNNHNPQEYDFSEQIRATAENGKFKFDRRDDAPAIEFSSKLMTGLRKKAKLNKKPLGLLVASFVSGFKQPTHEKYSKSVLALCEVNRSLSSELQFEIGSSNPEHIGEVDLLAMDEALLKQAEEEIREWGILNDKNFSESDDLYMDVDNGHKEFLQSHL